MQKRETKAINKLCVREILSLSFVCGAYFFEFRGRNLVCVGIAYNFDWGRHMQIRAGSREGTHAHCVFHACPPKYIRLRESVFLIPGEMGKKLLAVNSTDSVFAEFLLHRMFNCKQRSR